MNSSVLSQVTRPAISAVSKRSFSVTTIKREQEVHHQVAPLTDATVYIPQGPTTTTSTTDTTVVFSPTVNHVFDD
ncbi:hypothetical protein INT47_010981 [Mucor saturninus]|uniref:Uncharacterized protein n=1 Tax=Mucor saturninus TaxID=64648 RepID=A0A8H7QS55_9FUNG|nr:hypothetical protein INT47_010981 [Mucor saturninus]